ncbi:MAG: metallophosphoesterase family protein [Dehalococcoidia bacterium]|nr:metallophosphoesterase family protein [Dehalococcoidia bacterium]
MRYAILSDIHSNLVAFQAVLEHLETVGPFDQIWCLGDVVGYGPAPNECIELLRSFGHVCIAGNHDWAAVDKLDISTFNPEAADAALWTSRELLPHNQAYLQSLPSTLVRGDFTMAHGSPRDPIWEYVLSTGSATMAFESFAGPYCLIGHSHIPLLFQLNQGGTVSRQRFAPDRPTRLDGGRWLLNPGSVGQPRDGDPRASYVLYDAGSGECRHFRIAYDIPATQAEMRRLHLPPPLADRLSYGW